MKKLLITLMLIVSMGLTFNAGQINVLADAYITNDNGTYRYYIDGNEVDEQTYVRHQYGSDFTGKFSMGTYTGYYVKGSKVTVAEYNEYATTGMLVENLESQGYTYMTLDEAKTALENFKRTMTPECAPIKIFTLGDTRAAMKVTVSNCADSYMTFAYQVTLTAGLAYTETATASTYVLQCGLYESHSEMTANEYILALNKAKQIAAQNNYGTTYEKIKRVYAWICDNVQYDYSLRDGSLYDAVISGKSVCAGYAGAFQVMMEAMGIESYICSGTVDGESHAWNVVKVDGKYYYLDATHGDTSTDYDKYLLFGTNIRSNITPFNISSTSYEVGSTPAETEKQTEKVTEKQTEKQTEKETEKQTQGTTEKQSSSVGESKQATEATKSETESKSENAGESTSKNADENKSEKSSESASSGETGKENQSSLVAENDTKQDAPDEKSSSHKGDTSSKNSNDGDKPDSLGPVIAIIAVSLVATGAIIFLILKKRNNGENSEE